MLNMNTSITGFKRNRVFVFGGCLSLFKKYFFHFISQPLNILNFYSTNRNGVVTSITGADNAIDKMIAIVQGEAKEPEKTDLLARLATLRTNII